MSRRRVRPPRRTSSTRCSARRSAAAGSSGELGARGGRAGPRRIACSPPAAAARKARRGRRRFGRRRRRRRQDAPDLQLAALHRQADGAGLREGDRDQDRVHRGHQRQRRVLRQDRRAAQAEPEHRPRHHRADRLDGRPPHRPRLRRAARRRQVPQQGQPGRQREGRELRSGPQVQRAVALGHGRASATTRRRPAASSPASTTSSTPSSRAR